MRFSDEFTALSMRSRGDAFIFMNKITLEAVRNTAYPPEKDENPFSLRPPMLSQIFGTPVMCYHGIPDGKWELIARYTGDLLESGNVFALPRVDFLQ
jgi:hypothetical protein